MKKNPPGIIVVVTMMVIAILISIALSFATLVVSDMNKARAIDYSLLAYYAAEAGLESSLFLLRQDSNDITIDDTTTLKTVRGGATLDASGATWSIDNSSDSESTVSRQRLNNGQNIKLYFLGRSDVVRTNNSESLTIDWTRGNGSPKLQVVFTQLDLQIKDIGGESVVINYTDINDVNLLDTPTQGFVECYEFLDRDISNNSFLSDYVVEIRVVGSSNEYVDDLVVKSYDIACADIIGDTVANGQAITNLTVRSTGNYKSANQEIVAHLPPKDLVSSVLGFVLFSGDDITKDYAAHQYTPPE